MCTLVTVHTPVTAYTPITAHTPPVTVIHTCYSSIRHFCHPAWWPVSSSPGHQKTSLTSWSHCLKTHTHMYIHTHSPPTPTPGTRQHMTHWRYYTKGNTKLEPKRHNTCESGKNNHQTTTTKTTHTHIFLQPNNISSRKVRSVQWVQLSSNTLVRFVQGVQL